MRKVTKKLTTEKIEIFIRASNEMMRCPETKDVAKHFSVSYGTARTALLQAVADGVLVMKWTHQRQTYWSSYFMVKELAE